MSRIIYIAMALILATRHEVFTCLYIQVCEMYCLQRKVCLVYWTTSANENDISFVFGVGLLW